MARLIEQLQLHVAPFVSIQIAGCLCFSCASKAVASAYKAGFGDEAESMRKWPSLLSNIQRRAVHSDPWVLASLTGCLVHGGRWLRTGLRLVAIL